MCVTETWYMRYHNNETNVQLSKVKMLESNSAVFFQKDVSYKFSKKIFCLKVLKLNLAGNDIFAMAIEVCYMLC